jgi:hypothetical protein
MQIHSAATCPGLLTCLLPEPTYLGLRYLHACLPRRDDIMQQVSAGDRGRFIEFGCRYTPPPPVRGYLPAYCLSLLTWASATYMPAYLGIRYLPACLPGPSLLTWAPYLPVYLPGPPTYLSTYLGHYYLLVYLMCSRCLPAYLLGPSLLTSLLTWAFATYLPTYLGLRYLPASLLGPSLLTCLLTWAFATYLPT